MRKWLLVLLALCLCCSVAMAESSVTEKTMEARSLEMNKAANTFVVMNEETRNYQIIDAELRPLSQEYPRIDIRDGNFEVWLENNSRGLLSGQGELMVPPEYDDVETISDRWAAGIRLTESTSENYDYETMFSSEKKFYLIDTVDIYYRGEKKATLSRMEWHNAYAFGDYLILQDRDRNCSAYNKDFVKSEAVPEYASYEYDDDYRSGTVTHLGSGQQAFVPGCTLTPDEVRQSTWVNKEKMLLDLQGNVLADLSGYYSVNIDKDSGLIKVRNEENKYGLLDAAGQELIPCKYDEIGYDLAIAQMSGYLYAVRDGKSGFVSLKDAGETGFEFMESAGKQRSLFIIVEDPREGTILVSAAAGELPGRYQETDIPYSSAAKFATVKETDGTIHVIDIWGNDVLNDNPEIKYTYDVTYSDDGSMILVRDAERIYHIYAVSFTEEPEETPTQPEDSGEPQEETPAEEDGTWTCENGHSGNTGNFCSECGAPKPAEQEDGTWTCENGHSGNTGNFCTECGAAKPQ